MGISRSENQKKMGKIKNGDAVHLVSVSGPNEGCALHSNMEEGAGLSFGSTEHIDLGWVLDMDRTHKSKAIRGGDVVHLRPCGWGDGCSDDFYFHSNCPEGGMMSGGSRNADCAWWIEGESKHVRDGDTVMLHAIADAHDESDRGPYMHSNGEEGGGFSFGGDSMEYGWQICKIDDWSTSKCGEGKKVKNGAYVHLRSVSGSCEGNVLHSNMEEGAMLCYGQTIMLKCVADGRDDYMHSNGEEGGGFSFGGAAPEYGWEIAPNHGWSSDSSD